MTDDPTTWSDYGYDAAGEDPEPEPIPAEDEDEALGPPVPAADLIDDQDLTD